MTRRRFIGSRVARRLFGVGLAVVALVGPAPAMARVTPSSAVGDERNHGIDLRRECQRYRRQGINVAECVRQVKIARDATAKYKDPMVALADGFVPPSNGCHYSSQGLMGQHWLRPDRAPRAVDPRAPQVLLYAPTDLVGVDVVGWDGIGQDRIGAFSRLKLVAVEYGETALVGGLPHYGSQLPDRSNTTAPPVTFGGQRFDGPMPGHLPIQPWHYDLHVWLWEHNPAGLFAKYNPDLRC